MRMSIEEKAINTLNEIIDEGWLISDMEKCTAIDACEFAIDRIHKYKKIQEIVKFGNVNELGFEYKPLVKFVDFTDNSSMLPRLGEDRYSRFCKAKPGTTRIGWVAATEHIWHDNLLYFRFPKKGRRKLGRYRHRRNRIWK